MNKFVQLTEDEQDMVLKHKGLAYHIAKSFKNQCRHVTMNDIQQEALIGLMIAVRKYSPEKGHAFSSYAVYWIKQRIFRYINENANLIKWPDYMAVRLYKANIGRQHGQPSIPLFPGERFVEEGGTMDIADDAKKRIFDLQSRPGDAISDKNLREAVIMGVYRLNEDDAFILTKRYNLDDDDMPWTLQRIANKFGCTRERIRQKQNVAERKLWAFLPSVARDAIMSVLHMSDEDVHNYFVSRDEANKH